MRSRDVGEDRRAFLARLMAAGGVSVVGCARPAAAPFDLAPSTDPYAFDVLQEPIVLRSGEALADRSFVLSRKFGWAGSPAVIVVGGDDVGIRNVRILGSDTWLAQWDDEGAEAGTLPVAVGRTAGIRIENVRDVAVEQVSIAGLPGAGISGHGIAGGVFRDVAIRHCYRGIHLLPEAKNRSLRLERVYTEDLWGPVDPSGRPGDASVERPGGGIGGEALDLGALRDSIVADCTAVGEMLGSFRLSDPQRVRIERLRGATLAIEGREGMAQRRVQEETARDVVVEDCVLDKGLGRGATLFDASCLRLSRNLHGVRVERCFLNAAEQNGHAIEMSDDAHGRVVGCTIRGFNGMCGPRSAHALELAGGSSVNEDFERVNRFIDQQRIRSERDPVRP